MADDRLNLVAGFKDNASAGVRKLGKNLADIKPSHGMAAAQKWMETFRKGSDQTVAAIRPVTGMMNSIGVGGLAASLSIGEMVKQFKELADSTLTLKELSRQSRISEDDLRRLRYAGERFHLNPDAVNGAINSWSAQMVGFRMHTSKFYNELALMNADVAQKIAHESPIEGLKDTLDYISRIKDPQVRKMWADDAGVGDMLPMLNRGPDGLASIFADAAREVKPMTQEMKDAVERFNTSVTNLRQAWDNIENDIGPSVLNPLAATIDKLDEALKLAAASPGDAAAGAAIIAGSFAAFWARARIMRGSRLAGGTGFDRAAGEMQGAAAEQVRDHLRRGCGRVPPRRARDERPRGRCARGWYRRAWRA